MTASDPRAAASAHNIRARRQRRFDRLLVVPIVICAVLLLAGNDDFGFDPAGWLDPFMYLGYFWHYTDHLARLEYDYKASRLPWILIGYGAHAIAPPVAASYVLVFVTLSAGGIALFLVVRELTSDRTTAGVTAAAWTSCTWVHGIGGWNYHMLAAADYFLIAWWLTLRSARSGSIRSCVAAGACAAAAIHTHLLFAPLVSLLVLSYWSARSAGGETIGRSARHGFAAAAGALALTLALASVNALSGGQWMFFMPQIERARQLMRHDAWWTPVEAWLPTATYAVAPAAFLLAGGIAAITGKVGRLGCVAVIQAGLALTMMGIAQFAQDQATLNEAHLGFPLYVYAFPCLGVALAAASPHAQSRAAVIASIVLLMAPLLLLMPTTLPTAMAAAATRLGTAMWPLLTPLLFALAGTIVMLALQGAARVLVFAAWFGVLNAWIAPAPSAYGINTPGYRSAMLELISEVDQITSAYDPTLDGIRYWWTTDERIAVPHGDMPLGWLFDSAVSTRGWQANLFAHDPEVPLERLTLQHLERAVCVALLSAPGSTLRQRAAVEAHFAAMGRPLRLVATRHLDRDPLAFDLTLLKPADAADRRGAPCARRNENQN